MLKKFDIYVIYLMTTVLNTQIIKLKKKFIKNYT